MANQTIAVPIKVVDEFSKTLKSFNDALTASLSKANDKKKEFQHPVNRTIDSLNKGLASLVKKAFHFDDSNDAYSENRMFTENFNINLDNTIQYTYADFNFLTQDKGVMCK